jgi:hypothetical protein
MTEKALMNVYDEIVKIRQLLEISLKDDLLKELEKVLTTKERKNVWALCDGVTDTKTIAEKTGFSLRSVQVTVKELQEADLMVVERRGFPKRRFDYVPFEWMPKESQ